MFALCPPQFERIGNECYYLSKEKVNWLDAQFQCLDRDSKLAEPNKVDDRRLRKHLLAITPGSECNKDCNGGVVLTEKSCFADEKIADLWLGGKYDWQNMNWVWGYNGRKMKYQAFGKPKDKRRSVQLHCGVKSWLQKRI